jgi:DnaK suppressor protein
MFSEEFLQKIKENLLAYKKELLVRSFNIKENEVDIDGDEFDEIQGNLIIEMNNQFTLRDNQKLTQIEIALQQLNDNKYGICEDCDEFIPEKRLLINPYTTICVLCAEEREHEDKQKKRD